MCVRIFKFLSLATVAMLMVANAQAAVIIDHDWTAGQGFVDGSSAQMGWTGQTFGTNVDSTGSGTATTSNAWTGITNTATALSSPAVGDKVTITTEFSLRNIVDAPGNATVADVGIVTADGTGAFVPRMDNNASDWLGARLTKNAGTLDLNFAADNTATTNSNTVSVTNADVGLDYSDPNNVDNISDLLRLTIMFTKSGTASIWNVMADFHNVDTNTPLGTSTGTSDHATVYAPAQGAGALANDLFGGWRILDGGALFPGRELGKGFSVDSFKLENNLPIPEPTTLALACLSGLAISGMRRRS